MSSFSPFAHTLGFFCSSRSLSLSLSRCKVLSTQQKDSNFIKSHTKVSKCHCCHDTHTRTHTHVRHTYILHFAQSVPTHSSCPHGSRLALTKIEVSAACSSLAVKVSSMCSHLGIYICIYVRMIHIYIGNCFYFGPFIRFTFQVAQICLVCVCVCQRVCVWRGRNSFLSIDRYHL